MKRENWINKIAVKILNANRARSVMVIISAAVIVMVITTAFNAAISVVVSAESQLTNQIGTTAQCSINNPTVAQLNKLQSLPYIRNVGYAIDAGVADYNDRRMKLESVSKEEWDGNRRPTLIKFYGKVPEAADEIALSKSLLQSLAIEKPFLGQKITLNCSVDSGNVTETTTKTFTISGWYRDERQYDINTQGIIYVSDHYAKELGRTVSSDGMAYFSFSKNPLLKEVGIIRKVFSEPEIEDASQEQIEKLQKDLQVEDNQEIKKVYRAFGYIYNARSLEPYLLFIIPVTICGFLLIFDCFYLSIFKNLRECGLLMTAGASLKQLNSILRRQAIILGGIGVAAGLPLSYMASLFAVPIYMTKLLGEENNFVWTFSSYFLGALFTYAIVGISSQAVNIYLGRVSTVDLLRCENGSKKKRFLKSPFRHMPAGQQEITVKAGGIFRLASSNVMRNAKVNFHVLLSLFIAVTVFLLIHVVISGIDPKQFAFDQLDGHDFVLVNKTFYGSYVDSGYPDGICPQKCVFDDTFVTNLKQQAGVKNIRTVGYLPIALRADLSVLGRFIDYFNEESIKNKYFKQDGYYLGDLWLVDTDYLMKSLNGAQKKQINIKGFENGDTSFVDFDRPDLFPEKFVMDGYVLSSGQSDQLNQSSQTEMAGSFFNGTENSFKFQNGGFCTPRFSEGISCRTIPPALFVSSSAARYFSRSPIIAEISIDTDKGCRFSMERYLEELIGDNSLVDFKSKEQLIKNMDGTKNAIYLLGYMLSMIVMLIGLLGFVNMTIINTELRKGEFATLRSIGMTRKQLFGMLIAEGIYNAVILILLLITVGNFIAYKLYSIFGYGNYRFPLVPLACISLLIIVLLSVIPLMVYSSGEKKSISAMLQEIN